MAASHQANLPDESLGRDLTPIGRALIIAKLIDEPTLRRALVEQARLREPLIPFLLANKLVNGEAMAKFLAARLGLEFVDLEQIPIDSSVMNKIPLQMAKKHHVLPIAVKEDRLVVAMVDPTDVVALDDVRTITRREIIVVTASWSLLNAAIERAQRQDNEAIELTARMASDKAVEDSSVQLQASETVDDAPIIRLVNLTITQANADRASDIHIEPREHDVRIRFRIDGVLHEVTKVPKALHAGMITRLKLMANLNIAEHRLPQDGRISLKIEGREVDLRLATLPTVDGEKVVIRILDKAKAEFSLGDLGFLPQTLKLFEESFRRPWGTILVTGPTGSGKSTTLYATLNILNSVSRNIITVEDPVEYRMEGISQVQVHAKSGLTFASALRSILRSDPDVILIGEIRDQETATIAVEAALTGHLVLSSLHTNDAASTPTRLTEMGIAPYLTSSALSCVVAQRLARRLCEACRVPVRVNEGELVAAGWNFDLLSAPEMLYRSQGCIQCSNTGYRGRLALHEVMPITEELERAIAEEADSDMLRNISMRSGMLDMKTVGMSHLAAGTTSLEEILRVVA